MIDTSDLDKFQIKVGIVDRERYFVPFFNKFHTEWADIRNENTLSDIYTTNVSSISVDGQFLTLGSEFIHSIQSPFIPENEFDIVNAIKSAVSDYVESKLTSDFLYPANYVLVVNYVHVLVGDDDKIRTVVMRASHIKVSDEPWPQPQV